MDLRSYTAAVRRHWWVILLSLAVVSALTSVAYFLTPATYASTVTFYVATPVANGTSPQSAAEYAQDRVNSYVALASSDVVAEAVVANTGVDLSPTQVAGRISAQATLNTVVMTATVKDNSATRSRLLAEGLANTFSSTAAGLDNVGSTTQKVYVKVVSGPTELGAVAPQKRIYFGVGIAVGLLIGLLLSVLLELMDVSLRSTRAAAEAASAPLVGSIPRDRQIKSGVSVDPAPGTPGSEAFRQLRTNVQFVDAIRPAPVLMIASAERQDGRTSICANLATAFAETGASVLLIDADLRRLALGATFSVRAKTGLSEVLAGQAEGRAAIVTVGEHLDLLPTGAVPPNPSELLGTPRWRALIDDLRGQYDRIIVDTPPLLPVTDAAVASTAVDGVVFVVRWGSTTADQVRQAVESVRAGGARVVGTVVNERRPQRRSRQLGVADDPVVATGKPSPRYAPGRARDEAPQDAESSPTR